MYDYGARFYSPYLGRFISPDTITPGPVDPQNLNRYSYVRNNPARFIDSSGHACGQPSLLGILEATYCPIELPGISGSDDCLDCGPNSMGDNDKVLIVDGGKNDITGSNGDKCFDCQDNPLGLDDVGSCYDCGSNDISGTNGPSCFGCEDGATSNDGSNIYESRGNPNPNKNPPKHVPGNNKPQPGKQTPQTWPPKADPAQTPPNTPTGPRPPRPGDPKEYYVAWVLYHVISIAAGEINPQTPGSYQPPGVESLPDGGV